MQAFDSHHFCDPPCEASLITSEDAFCGVDCCTYRPVTLVGYSMGARLIYHCLLELARFNGRGIVESAILLGTTVTIIPERFQMARSVVAGR